MRHIFACLFLLIIFFTQKSAQFFFPSTNGCSASNCGCAPAPVCPVQPRCQPISTCSACSTCPRSRKKREILSNATYLADHDHQKVRVKRDEEVKLDMNKCNSDELRQIIEKKIDRVTAIAKRRIQEEAESQLNGRFNVICSRGDLSYVTNTELYCQHTVGDVTCFLFKQLSDVVRMRLA